MARKQPSLESKPKNCLTQNTVALPSGEGRLEMRSRRAERDDRAIATLLEGKDAQRNPKTGLELGICSATIPNLDPGVTLAPSSEKAVRA